MNPNDATINSTKTRFARRFLRSLLKIHTTASNRTHGSRLDREKLLLERSYRIKIAAYTSMARAVGSRRTWSRVLLFKLRNRRPRFQQLRILKRRSLLSNKKLKKKENKSNKVKTMTKIRKNDTMTGDSQGPSHFDVLRKLVPGGDLMDVGNLLEETAHYIRCLDTQVKVMKTIADQLSK